MNNILLLNNLLCRLVHYLLLNSLILNSFLESFLGNIFNIPILVNLRNIFSLVLNSVVVSNLFLTRNVVGSLNSFVFDENFFIGNVLNSRFSFYDFALNWRLDRLRYLLVLDRLRNHCLGLYKRLLNDSLWKILDRKLLHSALDLVTLLDYWLLPLMVRNHWAILPLWL